MSRVPRLSLEELLQLADELESAAFRWGAQMADPDSPQEAWEEARTILRARRIRLAEAIAEAVTTASTARELVCPEPSACERFHLPASTRVAHCDACGDLRTSIPRLPAV